MIINRPPAGQLYFDTPIYEHDTPLFRITASDPDLDPLSVVVESSYEGGGVEVIQQWTGLPSGSEKAFTYGPLPEGSYTMRLTVTDGRGGVYSQTYSFEALPLELTGEVTHTPEWEAYRLAWNAKHADAERASDVFWAGEAFVLGARVTDTGSSKTKAERVTAVLMETGEPSVLLAAGNGRYTGELFNTEHHRMLKDGSTCLFRFTVEWSNGYVQTTDVQVRIRGSIYEVIVQQIRH
ncbi:Ig-like domain-containing protein [Paenibacillus sp. S-38]|uniref:Ig-like domain-containing protein n=1 Tax=Paenibacillus sp. S-38 TaxID=3416710 RepID=UPI003CFA9D79